jgi:hypothetical protein
MSKNKQRHGQPMRAKIGYSRMLGSDWIEQSGDPDYAWEVPRLSVEINVIEPVAQKLAQGGRLEGFSRAFFTDVLGRLHVVLGLGAAQRLTIIAVPVQDEHGKQWVEESAKHGDFAVKVRCPSKSTSTTVYYDNEQARENDARYNEIFEAALVLPADERPLPDGGLERMAELIAGQMARPYLGKGLRGVHFFLPQVFTP